MEFHLIDFIEHVLNILVFFLLLRTFLYKPVKKFMDAREAKFASERAEIDADRKDADALKTRYEASMADAKIAAERIAEEKRKVVERESEDVRDKAKREAQRILTDAKAQAAAEHEEMLGELKAQTAELAVGLAGKILEREVNPKDHQHMIDSFFKRVV